MIEKNQEYVSRYLESIPELTGFNRPEFLFDNSLFARAARFHLIDPTTTALNLAKMTGININEIAGLYEKMQIDPVVKAVSYSIFYPRRIMTQVAQGIVTDLIEDPNYARRLLNGDPVLSKVVEIHATSGVCDFSCAMCLWSDKKEFTYATRGISTKLLGTESWCKIIESISDYGTRDVLFSGGGEPLLRKDLFSLVRKAREVGLRRSLFTNGYSLDSLSEADWEELVQMDQVRISIHSPKTETYGSITSIGDKQDALRRVQNNVRAFIDKRTFYGGKARIGISFLIQPLNYNQIIEMIEFADDLGVDFLSLRQDEVSVTRDLNVEERARIGMQLRVVRQRYVEGNYPQLNLDIADDLTALANGILQETEVTKKCYVKDLRPAISPFGVFGTCDLAVEPRFMNGKVLGDLQILPVPQIIEANAGRFTSADCIKCMPSGRTNNAIINKILSDAKLGIYPQNQPFNFR